MEQQERLSRLIREKCVNMDLSSYMLLLKNIRNKLSSERVKKISSVLKAVSNINRLKIILLLFERDLCGCEINVLLGLSQPTTSHHLQMLEEAGLISSRVAWRWKHYALSNNGRKFLKFLLDIH
ncbi:MAG: metalloregulator ArsR/SmtB family transcription factor [Candidatus Odinarchaeota archaeon]